MAPSAQSKISNLKSKIIALVGPTSSGKSELAVRLAKHFNGEIISCDSRQIYRGMDLGTGKVPGKWYTLKNRGRDFYKYKGIVHHCIDYVNPRRQYSVSLFKREAEKAIANISSRGKLPILCGGTGHWVDAVVFNQQLPDVKPNTKLRARLEKKSADELYWQLKKLDPRRAKNIDRFNKRRLIRALEIISATGKAVPVVQGPALLLGRQAAGLHYSYHPLWLGLTPDQKTLYQKIDKRLLERIKAGTIKEVQRLHSPPFKGGARGGYKHARGLSWRRLESFGLEYKFVSLYIQKKLSKDQMVKLLSTAIKQYSKRQMTWFKRNKNIHWIENYQQAAGLVQKFLK